MNGRCINLDYKLQLKFYYVDGSEQYNTIHTDSIELAILDYKSQITQERWIELPDDDGKLVLINTSNVINIEFKEIK